jgi:hypothetical protein
MKKSTIKVKINSNGEIIRVVGNVGQTRMNRAAAALWAGNIEPTFGYKLHRFIVRAVKTFNAKMDEAAAIAYGTDVPAAEVPYIGLLEEHV